jgi:low temperature requirement protein LtrA
MRGLDIPERTEDFSADPVELFFDLAYVFAFSQLVSLLLGDPTWDGIGDASLIFLLLWLPWSQFTWSANAVPGNQRSVRILFLVATAASVPMAASVTTALGDGGALFAVPLAIIFLTALGMMVIGLDRDSAEFGSAIRYAGPNIVAMAIIVVGGFVGESARITLWIVGIAIFLLATIRAGNGSWIIRSGHFAERHGLIIIIAMGEVIVALGNSVVKELDDGLDGVASGGVIALAAAGTFAGLLFWSYFDRVGPAFEHRSERLPAAERGRFARDVYTYIHAPIVAGVLLTAVGFEEMALHPDEPTPDAFRFMAAAGLALFFGGIAAGVHRSFGEVAKERLVAVAAVVVLMAVGADLHGVWLIVLIDVIVFLTLVVEHLRIEGRPSTRGSVDDAGVVDHAAEQPLEQPPAG